MEDDTISAPALVPVVVCQVSDEGSSSLGIGSTMKGKIVLLSASIGKKVNRSSMPSPRLGSI